MAEGREENNAESKTSENEGKKKGLLGLLTNYFSKDEDKTAKVQKWLGW